jgi:hypothetical protein
MERQTIAKSRLVQILTDETAKALTGKSYLPCQANPYTATRRRTQLGRGLRYHQNENCKGVQDRQAQRATNI